MSGNTTDNTTTGGKVLSRLNKFMLNRTIEAATYRKRETDRQGVCGTERYALAVKKKRYLLVLSLSFQLL